MLPKLFHLAAASLLFGSAALACSGAGDGLTNERKIGAGGGAGGEGAEEGQGVGISAPGGKTKPGDPLPASPGVNNTGAKAVFSNQVFPSLRTTCAACHGTAGPGPAWFFSDDVEKTYTAFENLGYIAQDSRILTKVHLVATTPSVTPEQRVIFLSWVGEELKARGNKAPVNIKEQLGACFDRAKFDAIGLANLRTTRRQNENANNCTGCNNAPCMTCHAADPSTGVIIANGNNAVPGGGATYTFEQAKLVPFIDLVVGTNGTEIVGSRKLAVKSDATKLDKPYTHPQYTMPATMQAAIDAFALDLSTKFKAGQCTTRPAGTPVP